MSIAAGRPTTPRLFGVRDVVEMVPGSVQLIDVHGNACLKHGRGDINDIVLVPQPTNDPNDPLNWSRLRKEYHFALLIIWSVLAAASVNWSGPIWVPLEADLNTTVGELNTSAALCFMFLALGCIILQPTAMKIGRRPIYLFGTLLNLVGCVVGGSQRSVQVYYVVNILTGFGAAPVDSLVQISTTDVFFTHERGTRLSLLALALVAGSFMGPVAAGHITENLQSWRWSFWYLAIFFGSLLVVEIFTLEESVYRRSPSASQSLPHIVDASSSTPVSADPEGELVGKDGLLITKAVNSVSSVAPIPPASSSPYWKRMSLLHVKNTSSKSWWRLAIFPFRLFCFPAIIWTGVMTGLQISWLSLLSVTQSEIFSLPPYNFGIAEVGDTNVAAFIGGIFGMLWGGPLSDWFIIHKARKNRGIMEPETRLWLLIFPAFINTIGLLMYGLGAYGGLHWILSAGIGTAFIGFGIGSGGGICLTFAIDSYPEIAAESMVLILFCRNLLGFAFTSAIQPMIDGLGGQVTTIILAVICLVSMMTSLIMIKWGKSFRLRTAAAYLHYINESA